MSSDPGRDIVIAKASLQAMADAPPLRWSRTATFGSLATAFAAGFVLARFPSARAVLRRGLIQATRELARVHQSRSSACETTSRSR